MTVTIATPTASRPVEYGVSVLLETLGTADVTAHRTDETDDPDVRISIGGEAESIETEGFAINTDDEFLEVTGADPSGAMYGCLELAEHVRRHGTLDGVQTGITNPTVAFRAVKFNLPWDPYRPGEQTDVHVSTCRDLRFWRRFLDMMARNRFNALTLWNLHPFPYLIRPTAYPEACPFDEATLTSWQSFWRNLFRMAHDRGIETYLLNWNIVVSPTFAAAYDVDRFNDGSELVRDYTRTCVTEVLDAYPALDGLGVSLCDWMEDMSPREKQSWFEETFLEGIDATSRTVKLLDRSVLTESIDAMRETIERAAAIDNVTDVRVPTKFNWSHGHSTTNLEMTHDYRTGDVDDALWEPTPEHYSIAWTVRNEDVFVLQWADPDFIREHLAINHAPAEYVDGYVIGSEGYIPAVDLAHDEPRHVAGMYAFERQWLFWAVWGRLLYDAETPDETFADLIAVRYGLPAGDRLLSAIRLGSTVPEEIAALYRGTWDYTLYAEGMLAPTAVRGPPDEMSPFISVDDLIDHEPLDSSYISIAAYVAGDRDGVTPLALAERIERRADRTLALADELRGACGLGDGELRCTIEDVAAWGHLGRYVAAKIRGGVALETYRKDGDNADQVDAVTHLRTARDHWDRLVAVTDAHYRPVPYARDHVPGLTFSWAQYREDVERDVTIARDA